jgi:hypothetical protein
MHPDMLYLILSITYAEAANLWFSKKAPRPLAFEGRAELARVSIY